MEINTKKSLKLEWTKVAFFIEPIIKSIIGREVKCLAEPCDRSYWSIEAVNDTFTVSEINKLLSLVDSDDEMCEESIPNDSDNSRSLGMKLSEALLKVALSTHWKESCITETSLWLIDFDDYWVKVPEISTDMCFINSLAIDCSKLPSKFELTKKLFENGTNLAELTAVCEHNHQIYGNHLVWHYPISDGNHAGEYLALVKEGVVCFPYDEISKNEGVQFNMKDCKLCSSEDIGYLIDDWLSFHQDIILQLRSMKDFLVRKEDA